MHEGEVVADADLVRRLLASQFPQWASFPLREVDAVGTDHILYRLGGDKCVRLPRIGWAAGQAAKEAKWLATLASRLPLRVPIQLGLGTPELGYPWQWSVCDWIEGDNANTHPPSDRIVAAEQLAELVHALWRIDSDEAPDAVKHRLRGAPLAMRDEQTRSSLRQLGDVIDVDLALGLWNESVEAPNWNRPPVLFHSDLLPGNLIVQNDRIVAVIDFGGLGRGDPACDLMAAWSLFDGESRRRFRAATGADDALWRRARGHALSQAALYAPYYRLANPTGTSIALRQLQNVLADSDIV